MQKAQRLLDLAAFLLRAAEPVSWREIQEQFPEDYGRGSGEAARRRAPAATGLGEAVQQPDAVGHRPSMVEWPPWP